MFHFIKKFGCWIFLSSGLMLSPVQAADNTLTYPVLVFVSFSMPMASLQQWAQQAKKIQAPLVVQGLVQGSFAKTQQAVKQLSQNESAGVVLDPRLFRDYHITQVPAVVVRRSLTTPCPAYQSCWQPYDIVSGDIGLAVALQAIADHGDLADVAQSLLSAEKSS
jgi:conjugal transfer pilus assembly protein TrbC